MDAVVVFRKYFALFERNSGNLKDAILSAN